MLCFLCAQPSAKGARCRVRKGMKKAGLSPGLLLCAPGMGIDLEVEVLS
jgi:hypothetical protein